MAFRMSLKRDLIFSLPRQELLYPSSKHIKLLLLVCIEQYLSGNSSTKTWAFLLAFLSLPSRLKEFFARRRKTEKEGEMFSFLENLRESS